MGLHCRDISTRKSLAGANYVVDTYDTLPKRVLDPGIVRWQWLLKQAIRWAAVTEVDTTETEANVLITYFFFDASPSLWVSTLRV